MPSPQLLSLIATLIVYPRLTTKTDSPESLAAANQALYLLRTINQLVGPVNANFATAFTFAEKSGLRSKRTYARRSNATSDGDRSSPRSGDEEEVIKNFAAQQNSLWTRGADFWHVVGWSFNCAAKWKGRWDRWKVWLELMLELLEDDFSERVRLADAAADVRDKETILSESLVVQYFGEEASAGRTERRRIMRAIFATGTDRNTAEFREIFEKETEERKVKPQETRFGGTTTKDSKGKRKRLNLDDGDFGDYYDDNDEDEEDVVVKEELGLRSSTRLSRQDTRALTDAGDDEEDTEDITQATDPKEAYGGTEAILLRRRILVLVSLTKSLTHPISSLSTLF